MPRGEERDVAADRHLDHRPGADADAGVEVREVAEQVGPGRLERLAHVCEVLEVRQPEDELAVHLREHVLGDPARPLGDDD